MINGCGAVWPPPRFVQRKGHADWRHPLSRRARSRRVSTGDLQRLVERTPIEHRGAQPFRQWRSGHHLVQQQRGLARRADEQTQIDPPAIVMLRITPRHSEPGLRAGAPVSRPARPAESTPAPLTPRRTPDRRRVRSSGRRYDSRCSNWPSPAPERTGVRRLAAQHERGFVAGRITICHGLVIGPKPRATAQAAGALEQLTEHEWLPSNRRIEIELSALDENRPSGGVTGLGEATPRHWQRLDRAVELVAPASNDQRPGCVISHA